jgi:hypothetical protein
MLICKKCGFIIERNGKGHKDGYCHSCAKEVVLKIYGLMKKKGVRLNWRDMWFNVV